ncbi:hypothetical protein COCMIDRAFT_28758 [Bipolaris oryzae ATCC 44560]|uniref:Uncharacterized protein n=1 Tax=Bipolaris oryzae ATCC 44560 TaxID=930090 RepID=W6Z4U7_COCMI|nr:uncharacterized protein COCMIDRAFT_28758 [Bipolaris oryzae ATCC 44560]EUC42629.1 hypothetical protein COCMIDRAFT_28758 [Bipolaris oryzae ATCC 44560]
MSCQPLSSVPPPPTTLPSCAVPIGGSNSSILDACCNGHINAIATYSAPETTSLTPRDSKTPVIVNSEDGDDCFQYCITDSPDIVETCLAEKMQAFDKEGATGVGMFGCFNVEKAVGPRKTDGGNEGSYVNAGLKISRSWSLSLLVGLSVVGALI